MKIKIKITKIERLAAIDIYDALIQRRNYYTAMAVKVIKQVIQND